MRLDKFLKVSRVLKRRAVAADACDKGKVSVNGNPSKPAKQLKVGDIVEVSFGDNKLRFRVLSLAVSIKKEDASNMYEIIS